LKKMTHHFDSLSNPVVARLPLLEQETHVVAVLDLMIPFAPSSPPPSFSEELPEGPPSPSIPGEAPDPLLEPQPLFPRAIVLVVLAPVLLGSSWVLGRLLLLLCL
jgi:hypothetical protein